MVLVKSGIVSVQSKMVPMESKSVLEYQGINYVLIDINYMN
jgi:hypothetical protein